MLPFKSFQTAFQWCQIDSFTDLYHSVNSLYLGFRVETSHIPGMKRKYLVNGLGPNAINYKFELQDEQASTSRRISVQQYFKEKYRRDLKQV